MYIDFSVVTNLCIMNIKITAVLDSLLLIAIQFLAKEKNTRYNLRDTSVSVHRIYTDTEV